MSSIGAKVYVLRTKIRESIIKSRFKRKIQHHTPIIVYQMGKVGSSSIYNSLKAFYPGIVLHRHSLEDRSDWQAQLLLEHSIIQKKPLKLISLVREPVGRNISAFFQNFEVITGITPNNSKFTPEEIKDILLSNNKMDSKVPLWWFDENVLKNFGINVFGEPFEKNKGWIKLQNGNIELLLMKIEINNEVKTQLIKEFISLKEFNLSAFNISENKDYASLYSTFKHSVKLPNKYLEMLYTAPQVKHFYTEKEIEEARKKWNT